MGADRNGLACGRLGAPRAAPGAGHSPHRSGDAAACPGRARLGGGPKQLAAGARSGRAGKLRSRDLLLWSRAWLRIGIRLRKGAVSRENEALGALGLRLSVANP